MVKQSRKHKGQPKRKKILGAIKTPVGKGLAFANTSVKPYKGKSIILSP